MMICSILTPWVRQPAKRMAPTGGVSVPTHRFMIIIRPKCTGCMPQVCTMGRKMGVKISTAGVGSMKQPTTSRITFMISRMMTGLSVKPRMALATRAGILV